jgi:hypothetical protein
MAVTRKLPILIRPGSSYRHAQVAKKPNSKACCVNQPSECFGNYNRFLPPSPPAEKAASSHEDRRQLSVAVRALRLRTLHPAQNISSALKGGVNLCQRRFLNEVLFDARRRQFLHLAAGATARCRSYRALQAQKTETVAVSSKRVVDGLNVPGSIPALPSVHKHDTASIACIPEKHLARQRIFGFLCGLETVLGVVLAQLDL